MNTTLLDRWEGNDDVYGLMCMASGQRGGSRMVRRALFRKRARRAQEGQVNEVAKAPIRAVRRTGVPPISLSPLLRLPMARGYRVSRLATIAELEGYRKALRVQWGEALKAVLPWLIALALFAIHGAIVAWDGGH